MFNIIFQAKIPNLQIIWFYGFKLNEITTKKLKCFEASTEYWDKQF